jgi:hypothetical protein
MWHNKNHSFVRVTNMFEIKDICSESWKKVLKNQSFLLCKYQAYFMHTLITFLHTF